MVASSCAAILEKRAEHGVPLQILQQAVTKGTELDVFNLVINLALDQKMLARRESANNVKKRDVW